MLSFSFLSLFIILSQAIISTRRLSRYLSCFEHEPEKERTADSLLLPDPNKQSSSENVAIFIHDASCTWSSSDEKQLDLVLDHVTLHIPKGLLVAVVGEVNIQPYYYFYLVYQNRILL